MTSGQAEWRCVAGGGGVALLHRGRLCGAVSTGEWSSAVTSGEAEWRCVIGGGGVAL